jgi:hypothetical protein
VIQGVAVRGVAKRPFWRSEWKAGEEHTKQAIRKQRECKRFTIMKFSISKW